MGHVSILLNKLRLDEMGLDEMGINLLEAYLAAHSVHLPVLWLLLTAHSPHT